MRRAIALIVLMTIGISLNAQNDREQQIASMRIAFLTKNLKLTPTEAQQFWPVYNSYNDKVADLQKEERQMFRELRQRFESIDDGSAQKVLDRHISIQTEKIQAREKLIVDLKGVIPAKKILILLKSEEDFKRSIFERLRERRQNLRRQ